MRRSPAQWRWIVSHAFLLLLFSLFVSQPAHADGGAPNLAYVSGTAHGISVIDVGEAKVTKTIPLAGDPHTILLSVDGRFLSATQPTVGQVAVLSAKTGRVLCTAHLPGAPTVLAMDQALNTLYTGGSGANRVTALDAGTCAIRRIFQVESPVNGIAVTVPEITATPTRQHQLLWVAGTDALTVFDDQTGKRLGSIALPEGPQFVSAPPGKIVYVTTRQGSVDAIDFQTHKVYQLLTGGQFGPMDYDALTGEVYVPDQQHNLLAVLTPIDTGMTTLPKEPVRVIHTGDAPETVAITVDGLLGFVALRNGTVIMLDLLRREQVYTVAVGGTPHFLITGLYPPIDDVKAPQRPLTSESWWGMLHWNMLIFLSLLMFVMVFLLWMFSRSKGRRNRL